MTKTLSERCGYHLALGALTVVLASGCGAPEPPPEGPRFVALDSAGRIVEVPGSASRHHCVYDRHTELTWSVEHDGEGLLSRDETFSWYSSDPEIHMNDPGLMDGGDCGLARCDTEALVAAVNDRGLCGHHDWRMPTRDEAMGLGDRRRINDGMTLDPVYFPHAVADDYWTGSTFRRHYIGAWAVDTRYALDRVDAKTEAKPVRLVRDPNSLPEENPR